MASKKIYVIIGDGRCGKSSLVRALTGVYRSATVEIGLEDKKTNFWMRVLPQSAQEANLSPEKLLEKLEQHGGSTYALVVVRLHSYKGHGPALDYLNALDKVHTIEKIVYMGKDEVVDKLNFGTVQQNVINSSFSRPMNGNANMVRKFWGWL